MLKKQHRLTSAECDQVFTLGKKIHTKEAQVVYLEKSDLPKCAIVVGKKLVKGAVLRNLLRRRWYSAIKASGYLTKYPNRQTAFVLKAEALPLSQTEVISYLKRSLFP